MALMSLSHPGPASPPPLPARATRSPKAVLLLRPANSAASRLRPRLRSACLRRPTAAGALSARCGVAVIDQSRFKEEVLDSDSVVLVEFVASWCGPCRLIAPVVDWAAEEYKDVLKVVKIDHDANPQLIQEYKVYGLPALILFKNGQEVPESRWEGAMTKAKLKVYLDSFLQSATVS